MTFLNNKPFLVAETGSNWNTLDDCLKSISLAHACGADAVKFQAYNHQALYGIDGEIAGSLPLEWLPRLAEKAKATGIEFMCSAFSTELLDAVNPYVNIHKLASSEMCHVGMLDRLKTYGKKIIVSTGAQTVPDINAVLEYLGPLDVIPLYCEASYPAKYVNFDVFQAMQAKWPKYQWGFSDHTLDVVETPRRAARLGASVIEKHVNFVGATGPDSPHSLSTTEFQIFVSAAQDMLISNIGPTPDELPMILRYKRRVIATRDIRAGESFILGTNFGIFRSLKDDVDAAHPAVASKFERQMSKRDIKAGDGISLRDV